MSNLRMHSVHRYIPAWILLGGLTLLLAACAAEPTPKTVTLDPAGGQVSARPGDTLELTLEANPSTGFIWEIDPLDPNVLQLAGEPEMKNGNTTAVGAPVTQTFRFKALNSGQADLRLVYHRPWEKGVAPIQTYSARVTVSR